MGNRETATKFSRLKSIPSIWDNYLEAATGGVSLNKTVTKLFTILTKWSFPYLNPISYLKSTMWFPYPFFRFFSLTMTPNSRSCRPEVFCKKGVLRNFVKFTGKHLCQSFFLNKIAEACNFIKKETLAQVFFYTTSLGDSF